jgi:hypothetical protein
VRQSIEEILEQRLPSESLGSEIDKRLKSIESLVVSQNDELLPELRQLATQFNLHDEEMRPLIDQVVFDLKAVRSHQDLEVYDAHKYPFLFVISEQKLKEGLQDNIVGDAINGIREFVTRHYRVHFCCNVCGKMARSGSKKFKRDRDLIQRTREFFSVVDHGQGGYELNVMRKSIVKFLKYAHIVLLALEWGVKLSGVPIPHLLSSVAKELCITDDMKHLVEKIEDISPLGDKLEEKLEKKLGKTLKDLMEKQFGGEGKGGDDDDSDNGSVGSASGDDVDDDDDANDKREAIKESGDRLLPRTKTEAELLAEWKANKPEISYEQIKLAKELLQILDDPLGDDTGLVPYYRSDGKCAWVCPSEDISSMCPTQTRSCSELFMETGYDYCLGSLEHLITNERK